jgi:hypothetical protein
MEYPGFKEDVKGCLLLTFVSLPEYVKNLSWSLLAKNLCKIRILSWSPFDGIF